MDEIRALQEELRRAQQSNSSVSRLPEKNCVQLIMKLQELGLLQVIHTVDGKQYLTPQQLEQEIQDEVQAHGGRISIADLEQILEVDLFYIEETIATITKFNNTYFSLQGDFMTVDYVNGVCEEIEELLQESGRLAMSDISARFNLPISFLVQALPSRLGSIINGVIDQQSVYTSAYVARQTARIRGLFSALTRPASVAPIIRENGFEERLFHSVLAKLIQSRRLAASLQGQKDKAVFIPDIVSRTQDTWVRNFFNENNYIEYDAVKRFGIPDPKFFVSSRCTGVALETCIASQTLVDTTNAAIEEALSSNSWLEVSEILPSPFSTTDIHMLINKCPVMSKKGVAAEVMCDTIVVSTAYINDCIAALDETVREAATAAASAMLSGPASMSGSLSSPASTEDGSAKSNKKREKAAKGKGGKSDSGAGAGAGGAGASSAYLPPMLSLTALQTHLSKHAPSAEEEFLAELAARIQRPLLSKCQELQSSIFINSGEIGQRRKQREELLERFRDNYLGMRLSEKALALFSDADSAQLHKHILRTQGLDTCVMLMQILAIDHDITLATGINIDSFTKSSKQLPQSVHATFARIGELLHGKTAGALLDFLEDVSGDLDVLLRKADRRKEKAILQAAWNEGVEKLAAEMDPASILHRAVLLLFQKATGTLLRAPGSAVPQLVTFLKKNLTPEEHALIASYQQRVMQLFSERRTGGGSESGGDLEASLLADAVKIRELVGSSSSSASE